jgi:hypothetical protein
MHHRPIYLFVLALGLAFAGCAIPMDPAPSVDGTVREYFWQPTGEKIRYDVYNSLNTAPDVHTITFTGTGDTIIAIDESNGKTGTITSAIQGNGIALTDIRSTALFPLPEGAYFSKYSSQQMIKRYLPVSNFMYFDGGAVAFTQVGSYTSTDRVNWTRSAAPVADSITATCVVSKGRLIAGSASGNLYWSEDAGSHWIQKGQIGFPIRTILSDSGTIYLAIEGKGVFRLDGWTPVAVGKELPTKEIASIALLPTGYGGTMVLAASRNMGLLRTFAEGNEPWVKMPAGIDGLELNGVYSENVNAVVTMANGDYYTSTDTAKTWTRVRAAVASPGEAFTDADVSFGRVALTTNNGRIIVSPIEKPAPQTIASAGANLLKIAQTDGGSFSVASQKGLQRFGTNGQAENVGPYEMMVDTARGAFTLLQASASGRLMTGSSWLAGNLYLQSNYFPITARVMEQLDSLKVDDQAFGDVFVVRYAFEGTDGAPYPQAPYWIIYFSRGIGPVMIDRIADANSVTTPVSRAVYKGKK